MKISSIKWKHKPNENNDKPWEVAKIHKDLKMQQNKHPDKIDLDYLADAIENGQTIVIDEVNDEINKIANAAYDGSYFIGLDFDDGQTIKETGALLDKLGIEFYIRYKSFSYTKEVEKHRYLIKVDEKLNRQETLKVYEYFMKTTHIDEMTTKNMPRLWYAGKEKLSRADTPGNTMSKDDILDKVKTYFDIEDFEKEEEQIEVKYTVKKPTLKNVEGLYEYIESFLDDNKKFRNEFWEYGFVRNEIYLPALTMYLEGFDEPFELFMQSLEKQHLTEWETYKEHDTREENIPKVYAKYESREVLKKFGVKTQVETEIQNKFDILKNEIIDFKGKLEMSLVENFLSHISKEKLLVAPAGSGKTTVMLDYCKKTEDYDRIYFIVPTIALAKQLEEKIGLSSFFSFHYSESHKNSSKSLSAKINVMTYDMYYIKMKEVKKRDTDLIIVDESHELIEFVNIKKSTIDFILSDERDKVFMTATPFNHANDFDRVLILRNENNKDIYFIESDVKERLGNLVECLKMTILEEEKTIVFINSRKEMEIVKETIKNEFPYVKVSIIVSEDKGEAFEELLEDKDTTSQIVLVTKVLNIGFDINDVFDNIIFADKRLQPNAILQFLNRERQEAKFFVITTKDENDDFLLINSAFKKIQSKVREDLLASDKRKLDMCFIGDRLNKHLITQKKFYEKISLSNKELEELLMITIRGINISKEEMRNEEIKVSKTEINEFIAQNYDEIFSSDNYHQYLEAESPGKNPYMKYPKNIRKRIYQLIKCFESKSINDNLTYEESRDSLFWTGKYHHAFPISTLNYISDVKFRKLIYEIAEKETISNVEKIMLCQRLNATGVIFNNVEWREKNFKTNLNKMGLTFINKRSSKKDSEGKRRTYLENVSILM